MNVKLMGIAFGFLCWSGIVSAQMTIPGIVVEENGSPIAFANVCLFPPIDSTKVLQTGMSDLKGNFQLTSLKEGAYKLQVTYLGFKTYQQQLVVNPKSDGQLVVVTLQSQAQQLDEVSVKGKSVRVSADKVIYVIGSDDLKGKTQALELVSRVPKLSVDPVDQKIKSHDGKEVKVLLNGMNASENILRTLRPEHILRMEHYDIPPVRFAQYGSVLNIITKSAEQGWESGLEINHAFTTGFGNDMTYFRFNAGRSQWSMDYNLYYRDYSDRRQNFRQHYVFDSIRYERQDNLKNAFGYDDHQINLGYVYQDSNRRALQIKFSPNYMNMHNNGNSNILFSAHDSITSRTGSQNRNSYVFNPVLDIYYSRTWKDGQEFMINAVGTAFRTHNRYINEEKNPQEIVLLHDFMNERNRKYSLITEAVYSQKIGPGKWDIGYQIEANQLTSAIDNTFETSDYTTRYQQHYLYSQWTGKWNAFLLNAQLGLAYRASESAQDSYDAWIFRPMLMLGYEWNEHHNLRWISKRENHEPGIAEWSNNRVYESDHIIRQGNPFLRHSVDNETYIDYTFQWNRMSLELIPYFCYTQSPINSYYTLRDDAIVYAAENGDYQRKYGLQYVFQCQPFNTKWLQLYAYGEIMKTELSSSFVGKYDHWNYPLRYRIMSNVKDFTFYYMGSIVGSNLDGPYLVSDENAQHLGVKYAKGVWSFSCSAYWIGTASKYHMHTIPESYVQKNLSTRINDNASMIVFGVSYAWTKGKSYKQSEKQLHHRDGDAGVFH